jgi:recombination protein RecA
MGIQARMMGQAMRKLAGEISKTKTIVIFINQLRMKIGVMFGNPETTTGGNALKFYATVRLDVRATNIKEGEQIVGKDTTVKVVKNKVAPPFKKATYRLLFGKGISRADEILDLGVQLKIIQKWGWYDYNGEKIGNGRGNAAKWLEENPTVSSEIESLIRENALVAGAIPSDVTPPEEATEDAEND